jgi:hypothetical protein
MHFHDRKWGMYKIAQENTYLLKRIHERSSFYSARKSMQDYDKTKAYKNNICVYPNIEFHRNIQSSQDDFRSRTMNFNDTGIRFIKTPDHRVHDAKVFGVSEYNAKTDFNKTGFTMKSNIEEHMLGEIDGKRIFFDKKVFFADLFHCMVKFYVEDQK